MSLHNSMSPKAIQKRIDRDQASNPRPLPMRSILNNAVFVALADERRGKATRKPELVAEAKATIDEAADQLQLLNWCEYARELEAERLRKAIEKFDAETKQVTG